MPDRRIIDGGRDVAEIARSLGLNRFAVVGWSSGGPYALASAVAAPEIVTAVACVASDAPIAEFPELLELQSPRVRELLERMDRGDLTARDDLRGRLAAFVADPHGVFGGRPDPNAGPDEALRSIPAVDAALTSWMAEAFRQGALGWEQDWLATFADWGFRLADVRQPVAIWRGTADEFSAQVDSDRLVETLPAGRYYRVADAGHLVPLTEWAEILRSVLEPAPAPEPDRTD